MSTRTIVDASGEIVSVVTGSDAAIALNTPEGGVAIAEPPPEPDAYRAAGAWVRRPARPSAEHTWDAVLKQWRDRRTLNEVKLAKWEQFKLLARRDSAANITVGPATFQADAESLLALAHAAQAAEILRQEGDPFSVEWTLADNTTVTLGPAQLRAIVLALHQRTNEIRSKLNALRADIEAATTRAEVAALTW